MGEIIGNTGGLSVGTRVLTLITTRSQKSWSWGTGSKCCTPVNWLWGVGPSSSWLLSLGSDLQRNTTQHKPWAQTNCTTDLPIATRLVSVLYRIRNSQPLGSIPIHLNPVHSYTTSLISILILSSHYRSGPPNFLFYSSFPTTRLIH
jgi:hypothetical protein